MFAVQCWTPTDEENPQQFDPRRTTARQLEGSELDKAAVVEATVVDECMTPIVKMLCNVPPQMSPSSSLSSWSQAW